MHTYNSDRECAGESQNASRAQDKKGIPMALRDSCADNVYTSPARSDSRIPPSRFSYTRLSPPYITAFARSFVQTGCTVNFNDARVSSVSRFRERYTSLCIFDECAFIIRESSPMHRDGLSFPWIYVCYIV